jgi:hypothetical protein
VVFNLARVQDPFSRAPCEVPSHGSSGPNEGSLVRDPIRAAVSLAVTVCLLLPLQPAWAQAANPTTEYRAKATFLANFKNFVEWPLEAFPSDQAPLLICVVGDFSFGPSLADITGSVSLHGRRVEVRWERKEKEEELRACHILFVSRSEAKQYGRVLAFVRGASVLTVGETPDFLSNGGAVSFTLEQGVLQFDVSLGAANDAHLKISSRMLALAQHVVAPAKAAQN